MNPGLFFRFDASPEIGLGHLRRCGVLAREALRRGRPAHLLIRQHGLDLAQLELPAACAVHTLPWELEPEPDARLTAELCRRLGLGAGAVDHYRLDDGYQQVLRSTGLRWLQFGNLQHRHGLRADLVHDASPGVTADHYAERAQLPDGGHWLTGPAYALVGEAFQAERRRLPAPAAQPVRRALLCFGGGDDRGAALAALAWLEAAGFAGTRVVLTTRLNPHLPALEECARQSPRIELHVDNWQPAPLMAGCQLALSAGGTVLYELACLGVPTAITCIADNQQAPARFWQAAGLATLLGHLSDLRAAPPVAALQDLIADANLRLALSRQLRSAVDGQGARRVMDALLELTSVN